MNKSARGLSDTSGAFLQLCLATTATSLTETRLTNLDRKIPTQTCPFGAIHLSGIGWGKILEHLILATKHGSLVIAVRAPELWPHWQTISPYPMLRWKSSCLALNPNIPTSNQANLGFPGFLWRKKWFSFTKLLNRILLSFLFWGRRVVWSEKKSLGCYFILFFQKK